MSSLWVIQRIVTKAFIEIISLTSVGKKIDRFFSQRQKKQNLFQLDFCAQNMEIIITFTICKTIDHHDMKLIRNILRLDVSKMNDNTIVRDLIIKCVPNSVLKIIIHRR